MKAFKSINVTLFAIFCFLVSSCSNDIEELETTEIQSNNVVVRAAKSPASYYYHFLRFEKKNYRKFVIFFKTVKKLVKQENGKILTTGFSDICLERECRQVNLVLQFDSQEAGEAFYKKFEIFHKRRSFLVKDLAYHVAAAFQQPEIFNQNVDAAYYFVGHINFLDLPRYLVEYGPNAINLIARDGGVLLSVDFTTPECKIGNCLDFSVLIAFDSKEAADRWYNSPDYQQLIPVREAVSVDGGLVLAPKF